MHITTTYTTSDGKTFDTFTAATNHLRTLALRHKIAALVYLDEDLTTDEQTAVIDWVANNAEPLRELLTATPKARRKPGRAAKSAKADDAPLQQAA